MHNTLCMDMDIMHMISTYPCADADSDFWIIMWWYEWHSLFLPFLSGSRLWKCRPCALQSHAPTVLSIQGFNSQCCLRNHITLGWRALILPCTSMSHFSVMSNWTKPDKQIDRRTDRRTDRTNIVAKARRFVITIASRAKQKSCVFITFCIFSAWCVR